MEEIESTVWHRRGSSIVWDSATLAPFLADGCLVSLREVLGWRKTWPAASPAGNHTILVGGLEACLELLAPTEAENFLRQEVKPLIREFQRRWDSHGLVFGFGASEGAFRVDAVSEEIQFVRRDQTAVRLSFAMWDGSTGLQLSRLVQTSSAAKGSATIGYYVPRIS
jgi:hypothetical protein